MKLTKWKFLDKRFLLDLIMPNRCPFCNCIIKWNECCCDKCREDVPYIDRRLCSKCGKASCICERGISYDKAFSVLWYDDNMTKAVVRYKTQSPDSFAQFISEKLVAKLKEAGTDDFDLVTCTPMSKKKLRNRGYNQAAILGKAVADKLKLSFDENILVKFDSKTSQHELGFEERIENADKSFGFNNAKNVKGKKILLVDDVITTASTLNSCSKLLKKNGAVFVVCATACNTKYLNRE